DFALEHSEAFLGVVGPVHILACFVVLQIRTARDYSIYGYFEGSRKNECTRGFDGEPIDLTDPVAVATACNVSCKRCVYVTIRQHYRASLERRNDVTFSSVREIC